MCALVDPAVQIFPSNPPNPHVEALPCSDDDKAHAGTNNGSKSMLAIRFHSVPIPPTLAASFGLPEATPSNIVLTQILQLGSLNDELVHLVDDV